METVAVRKKLHTFMEDIKNHVKRLKILSEHRRNHNDKRNIEGAVAGGIFTAAAKRDAIKAGLYVIEQSGDSMKIEMPAGFVPQRY